MSRLAAPNAAPMCPTTTGVRRTCDGLRRRDFLAWGTLGAAPLSLGMYQRLEAAGELASQRAEAGILVFLRGGASHVDSFDMKPEARAEVRGEFKAIGTKTPGLQFCEHLPRLAQCSDLFTVLHGVSHSFSAHDLGVQYLASGTRPIATLGYPSYSAVLAKERPPAEPVPAGVAIPAPIGSHGFLGSRYAPFSAGGFPAPRRAMSVQGITLPRSVSLEEFARRHDLRSQLDRQFAAWETQSPTLAALDGFAEEAAAIIRSPKTREAFDLSREAPAFAKPFGDSDWGQAALLAIRLVEAGVRFVTLSFGGWDTHANNFPTMKNNLLPKLDVALSALIVGLEQRGLLASTAVMAGGEFGRTPEVNKNAQPGRDHYARCMSVVLAGGRIARGRVVGASDATASAPAERPISPDDLAATFYRNLGIDARKQYQTSTGRPITLVRDGTAVDEAFG